MITKDDSMMCVGPVDALLCCNKVCKMITKDDVIILQSYPSQTKILQCRTNISECVFEALFNVV